LDVGTVRCNQSKPRFHRRANVKPADCPVFGAETPNQPLQSPIIPQNKALTTFTTNDTRTATEWTPSSCSSASTVRPQMCCNNKGSLHCASCVPYMERALARLSVDAKSIRVSVAQQSVSFSPPAKVSRFDIHNALAGFEVESESGPPSSGPSLFASALQARRRKRTHFRNCEACKVGRPIPLESLSRKQWIAQIPKYTYHKIAPQKSVNYGSFYLKSKIKPSNIPTFDILTGNCHSRSPSWCLFHFCKPRFFLIINLRGGTHKKSIIH
jgi:hypothetical protein